MALVTDSLLLRAGDSADDGRTAGDAGGAALRLIRELKAHSKTRTPVVEVAKAMKRTEAAVRLGERAA
jgi:hypothetical protein